MSRIVRFWKQVKEGETIVIYYKDKHGNEIKEEVTIERIETGGGTKSPAILSNGMVIMKPNALFCWRRVVKEEVAVASFIQKYSNVQTTENIPVEIELCDKSLGRGKSYMSTSFQTLADEKGMYVDDRKVDKASTWHTKRYSGKIKEDGWPEVLYDFNRTCFTSNKERSKEEWKDLFSELVKDVDDLLEEGLTHLLAPDSYNLIYVPSKDERFHFVPRLFLFDFSSKSYVQDNIRRTPIASLEDKKRNRKSILNKVVYHVLYEEYNHLKSLEGTSKEKEKVFDDYMTYCMKRLKWLLEEL